MDVFAETRRLVSARQAAEYYGFTPNRANFIPCPLHHEKTPSLKLYQNGTWHCFGCGKGGSSIDFTAELFGLTPLDAVRQLDRDFSLNLPLDRQQTPAERREAEKAAQRRREVSGTYQLFEKWRAGMLQQLTTCFREGHFALQSLETPSDLDRLTDAQARAVREQARVEYYSDLLLSGTMADMMAIFRDRKGVETLCNQILGSSQTKSGAA